MLPVDALRTPLLLALGMVRPGGSAPLIRYEPAGIAAPVPVNATGVMAVPTVPVTLLLLTTNCVAPASECIAPREAAAAAADLSNDTMREGAIASPATAVRRRAGVRCKRSSNQAAEKFSQRDFFIRS